jgi:aconitate hydratase
MMRGTFANIRIKNEMMGGKEGGNTKVFPGAQEMSIYDAAMHYAAKDTPLVIFAGKEYGTGSSRDWAAKGTKLLGVKAVIAESFERIHRSNLVGMGLLPLEFPQGMDRKSVGIKGDEVIDIVGLEGGIKPRMTLSLTVIRANGARLEFDVLCRIDTLDEVEYYKNGGILPYVLRKLADVA